MCGDPTRVRLAVADDEDELVDIVRLMHGENGIFTLCEDKVRETLRNALSGPVEKRRGLIGAIGPKGSIEGSIYLEVGTLWYSSQWTLIEQWNFVLPPFRRSTGSKDLISFAKLMSDKFGLPLVIGVLSNERTEAKVRLYRKQLGEPAGAFFVHGLGRGAH